MESVSSRCVAPFSSRRWPCAMRSYCLLDIKIMMKVSLMSDIKIMMKVFLMFESGTSFVFPEI